MMDRSRLRQQQLHDDRRYASPSSVPPMPSPMMCSRQETVNTNNNFNHHGGGSGASSLPIQWSNGPNSSCNPTTTTNYSNGQDSQHADGARRMNDHDGHYSSHQTPMMMTYCPQPTNTTLSSRSNQTQNTTVQKQKPTQDIRFLYTLYNILSSLKSSNSGEESSITWLDHGQAFFIHDKSMFERTLLRRILPNVKYASFVKRLKRYKFVRISSGSELGAYYHPYFRRDQPHLLPLINTMDEIPIEKYGVNVTNVVTFGASGGGGGSFNVGRGGDNGGATFIVDQPPVSSAILKQQDDFVPTAAATATTTATFHPILKTTGNNTEDDDHSIHSASLSLGSISPISVSRGVSLTVKDDLLVDPSLFEDLVLPFKEGNTDDDDDVTLESLEDDALLDHLESKICGGRGGAVASCAATMKEASLLHLESKICEGEGGAVVPCAAKSAGGKEEVATKMEEEASLLDKAVLLNKDIAEAQQLLHERVLQFERANLPQQVQIPPKQVITAPTPTVSPFYDVTSPHSSFSSNTTGKIGSCAEEDMKSFPDMLRQISKAKRRESSMSSQSSVEEDMKSFPDMLRQISKAKRRENSISSQQKRDQMPSTSPVTTSFSTTTSTTLTTSTSPVTSSHSMSTSTTLTTTTLLNVPTGTSIGGEGHNVKRSFLSSRRGSAPEHLETIRENTRKHQVRRRSSVSPQNNCYTMDDKSGKYRYPRKRNVTRTSPTFEKQLGRQQHPEEAQSNFGSLDWSQHSVPDLQLNLVNFVTSYYKPHAGHPHCNQPQQEQPSMMLPPSPPASTQSHQNSHNYHQQQLSETILHNVQQAKILLYNGQQQNYGECTGQSSEELELSDGHAYGNSCENFDRASPLRPEQQFPSYKRRCTL